MESYGTERKLQGRSGSGWTGFVAWQSGAISQDTLLHNLRTGEILPSARTNEQELELIRKDAPPVAVASQSSPPRAPMAA